MAGLNLITSNRLEILVHELAGLLSTPLSNPLNKEIVVVQSKGMQRWVSLELARRHGICANMQFPFPSRLVADVFRNTIPEASANDNPFDPAAMTWSVMEILPALLSRPGFEMLHHYLSRTDHEVRLFQISSRIAETFDHYLLFRPDMILGWEAGKEDHWQAVLWRSLVERLGAIHPASLQRTFIDLVRKGATTPASLPERLSIFGISALPPFHMEVFAALDRLIDVHLFIMNPCREYWGDIVSGREMNRVTARHERMGLSPDELYLETGNALLSSLGIQGRDFFELIGTYDGLAEASFFFDPGRDSLLRALQSDILNLRKGEKEDKALVDGDDRSLLVHSCHSAVREMEVLQDQLLYLFETHTDLKPSDIIVMTPDIGIYAPFIQAVFSLPREDPRYIPYTITDRELRQESAMADHFMKLLDLKDSRFSASSVFDLLETSSVRAKFSFTEDDLELIHTWIDESGIRWGIDAPMRAALDLPTSRRNTWREGLERMLLGYAMPSDGGKRLFESILPFDLIEGSDTAILERLLAFTQRLFAAMEDLSAPRPVGQWSSLLKDLLDSFFFTNEEDRLSEVHNIRQILDDLASLSSAFSGTVPLDVIRLWLKDRFEKGSLGHGFLAGGVTFCAMLPMRSIPFKTVCLVGMNDGSYPRESPALAFDLMIKSPRPGDRSRRQDDRYLFLEALLSARQTFYISYVGQSIEDNSIRPPSVLVSELLDCIDEGYQMLGTDIIDTIVTKHPLQAFSAAYFKDDGRLFSYDDENCRAAQRAMAPRRDPAPFVSSSLPEPDDTWRQVEVEDLCRFFAHPSGFFLSRRLGLNPGKEALMIDEQEPFSLDALDMYGIRRELTVKALSGLDPSGQYPVIAASGRLPHGTPGEYAYSQLCLFTEDFTNRLRPFTADCPEQSMTVDLSIGPFRITGCIDGLYNGGCVYYRPTRIKTKDYLRAWIYHLILNRAGTSTDGCRSILVFEDASLCFRPVADPDKYLLPLLNQYFSGLSKPIKFFPESSFAFVQSISAGKDERTALQRARDKWEGFKFPENADWANRRCFGHGNPLDAEFVTLAVEIIGPILEYRESLK
ncbi:MAG: RecBCD enzyme subunit RecC [Syntrophus sp. SKADARSKE-3]|nr:RecBCD enzyme subunit RecC [Syntrophus sp. SKADARSKE-3]